MQTVGSLNAKGSPTNVHQDSARRCEPKYIDGSRKESFHAA